MMIFLCLQIYIYSDYPIYPTGAILPETNLSCYFSSIQSVMFPWVESKLMPTLVTGLPQRAKRWAYSKFRNGQNPLNLKLNK